MVLKWLLRWPLIPTISRCVLISCGTSNDFLNPFWTMLHRYFRYPSRHDTDHDISNVINIIISYAHLKNRSKFSIFDDLDEIIVIMVKTVRNKYLVGNYQFQVKIVTKYHKRTWVNMKHCNEHFPFRWHRV